MIGQSGYVDIHLELGGTQLDLGICPGGEKSNDKLD